MCVCGWVSVCASVGGCEGECVVGWVSVCVWVGGWISVSVNVYVCERECACISVILVDDIYSDYLSMRYLLCLIHAAEDTQQLLVPVRTPGSIAGYYHMSTQSECL